MILGKRTLSKRMTKKFGKNIYKIRRKKTKVATVASVKKMLTDDSETKHVTGVSEFNLNPFVAVADTYMPGARIQPIHVWPDLGNESFHREGKQIKKVTTSFRIKLMFYINTPKAQPAVQDYHPFHTCRVIIWTCAQDVALGNNFAEYFNMLQTATNGIDLITINRNKIIVLKDKLYNIPNIHFHYNTVPPSTGNINRPVCAMRYINLKRRWKKINFPTNTSTTPTKASNQTYLSILPVTYNLTDGSASVVGFCNYRTRTYFHD